MRLNERVGEISDKLDRIIALLELQTFPPDPGESGCSHEKAIDIGVMGMKPGEKMRCMTCGEILSRIVEERDE